MIQKKAFKSVLCRRRGGLSSYQLGRAEPHSARRCPENTSDLANQVGLGAALRRSVLIAGLPVMEPAACHSQNRTQQADRVAGAIGGDEGEIPSKTEPVEVPSCAVPAILSAKNRKWMSGGQASPSWARSHDNSQRQ